MKPGFMLIELLIATAISAVLSVLVLGSLYQTNRVQLAIDKTIDVTARASILQYYMERDIVGAFVPVMDEIVKEEKTQDMQNAPTQQPQQPKKPEKKAEPKQLEKPFYGVNKDKNLAELTMITSNPLITYWDTKTGSPKARIARVTYTLEPSAENKDSYILYRTESQNIEWHEAQKPDEKKQERKHELVRDVKELLVEYEVPEEKKEETAQGAKGTEEKKEPPKYTLLSEWQVRSKDESAEKKSLPSFPLPEYVRISVRFWMPGKQESAQFKSVCRVMVFKESTEKKEEKKSEQKAPAPLPPAVNK